MRSLLALLLAVTLVGCSLVTPVTRSFPDRPAGLKEDCPELQEATAETKELSKLLDVVVVNYSTYYECRVKIEAWDEWYQEQKKIFDEVK
jgi:hypothetical protein